MRGNQQVGIRQFILTQTGTYQEQTLRPFHTHVQADALARLDTATQGGKNVGASAVQSVASEFIQLSAIPEGVASIREGWASRRFRFLMLVEEQHPFTPNDKIQRVFFGYTDHSDASYNHLDPQMRIYFNSETTVSTYVRPTPNGPVVDTMVTGANQIIAPVDMAQGVSATHALPTAFMIRPEDIFHYGQTYQVVDKLRMSGAIDDNIHATYDARSMVGQGGGYKYSKRRDTTPSRYMSDTLTAYKQAVSEATMQDHYDGSVDREILYGEAESYIRNQDITRNSFFSILKDHAGYLEKGYVTLAELHHLFPESTRSDVTMYSLDDGRSIRQVNLMEHSEHWRGSDNLTLAAATLGQIVPSIMMDNTLRSISFSATNGRGIGQYAIEIHPTTLRGIVDGLRLDQYLQEFERRLIFDALNPITHMNQIGFQISMHADLAGDSVIDIGLGSEPICRYVVPTFSDSLWTPMMTLDHGLQSTITNDLLYVVDSLIPSHKPSQTTNLQAHSFSDAYNAQAYRGLEPTPIYPDNTQGNHNGHSGLL